jgi:filamentous hemagglutinin family protein
LIKYMSRFTHPCAIALAMTFQLALPAYPQNVDIRTDGTTGAIDPFTGPTASIPADRYGSYRQQNVFFSFDRFNIGEEAIASLHPGETGRSAENVIARVTGSSASNLRGTLLVEGFDEDHFFFINPNGVIFGPNARVFTEGSLHVGTADELVFDNGDVYSVIAPSQSVLSSARPEAFGFLGPNAAEILVEADLRVPDGRILTLAGGDVVLDGAFDGAQLVALGGTVRLLATKSAGRLSGLPDASSAFDIESFEQLGAIKVVNGSTVSTSGWEQPAELDTETLVFKDILEGAGCVADACLLLELDLPRTAVKPDDIVLAQDAEWAFVLRPRIRNRASGRILVRADSLKIEDSDLRSISFGLDPDSIDIRLRRALAIKLTELAAIEDTGVSARAGKVLKFENSSSFPVFSENFGRIAPEDDSFVLGWNANGGAISIEADEIFMSGGGRIATTTFASGPAGDITLQVSSLLEVEGTDTSADPNPTGIFANSQGGPDANGGMIWIGPPDAMQSHPSARPDILLEEGGAIIAQTTADADAGDIIVHANRIDIQGSSQIDNSTSAQSLGEDPPEGARTSGRGGDITIHAADSIFLSGSPREGAFGQISTSSKPLSDGSAGSISVVTPELTLVKGARIAAVAEGEGGDGGNIQLEVSRRLELVKSLISATTEGGEGGFISINGEGIDKLPDGTLVPRLDGQALGKHIQLAESEISTSVGDATGDAGNILLRARSVAFDASSVGKANAISGDAGNILVAADVYLGLPDSLQAFSEEGVSGTIAVTSPIANLEGQVKPPPAEFLNASSMLLAECSARRSGDRAGSFTASRWPGLPASSAGPLLAFDPIIVPSGLTAREPSAPPAAGLPSDKKDTRSPPPPPEVEALVASASVLRGGRAEQAAAGFDQVAMDSEGEVRTDALRGAAQARQLKGEYADSVPLLEEALAAAQKVKDQAREAAVLGQLGNAFVALRDPLRAKTYLTQAAEVARETEDPSLLATALNNLGNFYAIQGDWPRAENAYTESARHAQEEGNALRAAQALANAARIALERGDSVEALKLVTRSRLLTRNLGVESQAIALRIHLADSYARLAEREPAYRREGLQIAHRALLEAISEAGAAGVPRLQSLAYGSLGDLYNAEGGRDEEALYLTHRALKAAEQAQAADLLARWHAQTGRIQTVRGETKAAVASFSRAVEILEQTRLEARAQYGVGETSFQKAVAPVYLALVDLLLTQSANLGSDGQQEKLRAARATMERFKAAELRDYFQDECVAALEAQTQPAEQLSNTAAIVYPVVLPDRLELLVSRASGIARYTVPISAEILEAGVQDFRRSLENIKTNRYLRAARELHDWLIAPYAQQLTSQGVDTLVIVPDGALRTIPWGALHNGEGFVIERFAVAVTPSLDLIAPKPLDPARSRLLLAGVSESVQGEPPLPNVADELRAVQSLYGGELLLNAQFRGEQLEKELRERPPGVVHIASHAQFTGDSRTSYVLTHDDKLTMDALSNLVGRSRFGEEPLELLMLSACETARGDSRAALGLAGVAVRAGARSAVGSLWSVSDEASSTLIVQFYKELGQQNVTKAEAMARAQRALLTAAPYDHPFYWAGFLVINNWL